MKAWLNIQYSIKYQYELAVQYQYQYGLILILNMDKNTGDRHSGGMAQRKTQKGPPYNHQSDQ